MIWHQQKFNLSVKQSENISKIIAAETRQFQRFCLLDSHDFKGNPYTKGDHCYRILAGLGMQYEVTPGKNCLNELQSFLDFHKSNWYFGHLNYDLKNEIEERLFSKHEDPVKFPQLSFFIPEIVIAIKEKECVIHFAENAKNKADSIRHNVEHNNSTDTDFIQTEVKFTTPDKKTYIETIEKIKYHLHRGDIYELNYCIPFIASDVSLDPLAIWNSLTLKSPSPLSSFYRIENHWIMSSTPERFIRKENNRLICQPIKGTAKRSSNSDTDLQLKQELIDSEKERAENVMIVDLVRNDLSHIAEKGSVKVEELFGIYEFPHVFQMISTISAQIKGHVTFTDILKSMFPMGSMTGAPKISAMNLIEKFENFQRGLFSGAVGYIGPDSDFDFNVIIRSILYNKKNKTAMIAAGSAITAKSDAESEYNECLLKAKALLTVLETQKQQQV